MRRGALALVVIGLVGACTPGPASLSVFAAASLRDALTELATTYHAETGVELTLAFDSSSALRAQIEEGAPADVFASADTRNPQTLADAGLTDGGLTAFAANLLTIVVPEDNPAALSDWTDLAGDGVQIVAAGEEVPITQYADAMVGNLASLDDAAPGFAGAVAANVVSREDNVRAVLAKIEVGEGDAAIVYVTDALSSDAIRTIPIPDDANVPATYAAVVVGASERTDAAHAFLGWLTSDGARAILADHGFLPPP